MDIIRRWYIWLLSASVVVFVAWAAFILLRELGASEDLDNFYLTREAVAASDAISHGWIPEWLPRSAVEIRESHNLDTNETWMSFRFDEKDRGALESCCRPATRVELPRRHAHRAWWPTFLMEGAREELGQCSVFACSESHGGVAFLALEKDRPQAWFWRP